MKTWYHAQWILFDMAARRVRFDGTEDRESTVSVYLDYDIGSWSFGVRFQPDPCWYDFNLDLGPLSLSAIYWRKPVAVLDPPVRMTTI